MRLSGWFVGVLAFLALIASTAVCSVVSYNLVRTTVIQAGDQGLQVDSLDKVVQAFTNPQAFATATPNSVADTFVTPTITPIVINPNATATPNIMPTDGTTIGTPVTVIATPTPIDSSAQYVWDDPRQIRILLLGIDERKGFDTDRAYRTDTIILLNIDPIRKTAGLVSFPRDLWVNIPNFQPARINTANSQGDTSAYPNGGGPRLLMDTIKANFGVSVDRYVRVNFTVFESVVKAIAPNGTEICVRETIDDPTYPDEGFGTIAIRFAPGCQVLDATRLLQYARTRKTQGSDFDRARRQQEVLDALRQQVLSAGGIANFVGQVPSLWSELSDSYQTNLSLDEIFSLGYLMSDIPRENIQFKVIDQNYVEFSKAPDGSDILIPQTGRIAELIQTILYPQVQVSQGDLKARADAEKATIRVFNGTDITGLASRVQEWLIGKGVTISLLDNDPTHNGQPTLIKDYGNNRWTAQYLASLMGLPSDRIVIGNDGLAANGIIIVVGPDIQNLLGQ